MAVERRQSPWWIPMAAVVLSALSLFLGPCFGAGTAAVGVYVANQTRSAVADQKLASIQTSVDKLVEQNEARLKVDGGNEQRLVNLEMQIRESKSLAEQALARATNAQIDAKSKR